MNPNIAEDSNSSAFMVFMIILATLVDFLAIEYASGVGTPDTSLASSSLPPQAVVCKQSDLCTKMI